MATAAIDLPGGLAAKASAEGLLSSAAIQALPQEKVEADETRKAWPPGFDPRWRGLVAPELFRQGEVPGDLVAPMDMRPPDSPLGGAGPRG